MGHKGRILFKYLKQIIAAIWKLFLLAIYTTAKVLQMLAETLAKITEKFIS